MKFAVRFVVLALLLSLSATGLFSQGYPMPSSTPQICTVCATPYTGLPTYPFSLPIRRHAGRFLDSQRTADWQGQLRTLRAVRAEIVPEYDRVYIQLGSGLAAYRLSTFFTSKLGQALNSVSAYRSGASGEQFLEYDAFLYPENPGSGWQIVFADGQERLYDWNWDDRGYMYVGYSTFGFGIVDARSLSLVKQVLIKDDPTWVIPTRVVPVKYGNSYYLLVSNHQGGETSIYDVTTPTAPTRIGTLKFGLYRSAQVGTGSAARYAIVRSDLTLGIYNAEDLILGRNPRLLLPGPFSDATSDGVTLYGVSGKQFVDISISAISADNKETVFTAPGATFRPFGGKLSNGYMTIWGYDSQQRPNMHIYRIQANGLVDAITLGDYIPYYYRAPPAGYARPLGYTQDPNQVFIHAQGGKEYLFYLTPGLGDVYEIQTRDAIDIDIKGGTLGTLNPNAPASEGPYYGDELAFSSTTTGPQTNVNWDFGNPEAVGTNTKTAQTGTDVSHRFAGIAVTSTAAMISRTVTASESTDATNSDSVSAQMKVPTARARIKGLSGASLITSSSASNSFPIVVGDKLLDASDGTLEGHYATWTIGTTATTALPTAEQEVGGCAATRTLAYAANYVPFTVAGSTIVPGTLTPYVATVNHTFSVRPFVASVVLVDGPITATTLTFKNVTRYAAASEFALGNATPTKIKWEVIAPGGSITQTVLKDSTIGVQDTHTIQKLAIAPGTRIVLSVTLAASTDVIATDCRTTDFISRSASLTLNPPDTTIIKVSGCQYSTQPCTLTAGSASNRSRSGWAYLWENGNQTGSAESFSPTFSTDGTFTVKLTASNVIGSTPASLNLVIAKPVCVGKPSNVAIGYSGKNTGCSKCTSSEPIVFTPSAFFYTIQECDSFSWDFGDNTPGSTLRSPEHKYAADGTYKARLTVSNSNGSGTATLDVVLGNQPPPPPQCLFPGDVYPTYLGSSTQCRPGTKCTTNEAITFSGQPFNYAIQPSCDTFSWNFGDNTVGVGLSAAHVYSQPGTYNVTLTTRNSSGSTSKAVSIVVEGTPPPPVCPNPPDAYAYIGWQGAQSGCRYGGSAQCLPGERVTFEARSFYGFQNCDTFAWSFGDGGTATGRSVDHIFQRGSFTVKLTVSNPNGSRFPEQTLFFGDPAQPPTNVRFTASPKTVIIGQPVTFTGSGDPLDKINAWNWKFGDGTTGSGQVVQHAYQTLGTFRVELTAAVDGSAAGPFSDEINVVQNYPFSYLLPVVAHVPGSNSSRWRTDLQIFTPGYNSADPLKLTLEFKSNTRVVTKELTVPASTHIAEDLLTLFTSADDAGSVIVTGNSATPPLMWTRTYAVSQSGFGTFGQFIPAISLTTNAQASTNPPSYIVAGVQSSPRYRTNLGLINPTTQAATVEVEAFDDSFIGLKLGDFSVTLNPFQFLQINDLTGKIPALANGEPYSLKVRNPAGNPIVAYGSMVDNRSSDPVFIQAISDDELKSDAMRSQILPGIGRVGSWRSDITIFNSDSQPVLFDVAYFDGAGAMKGEIKSIPLAANAFIAVSDILKYSLWPAPIADSVGTLKVSTTSTGVGKYPVTFGRTYNDKQEKGTFGQGIPGVSSTRGNAQVNAPAYIPGVRSDEFYYSNFGLVALGTTTTHVRVSLLDAATGAVIGSVDYPVEPNQSFIDSNVAEARGIIRKLHPTATSGTLKVEVLTGGPVWAYASIIDRTSNDPEYVPAIPTAITP